MTWSLTSIAASYFWDGKKFDFKSTTKKFHQISLGYNKLWTSPQCIQAMPQLLFHCQLQWWCRPHVHRLPKWPPSAWVMGGKSLRRVFCRKFMFMQICMIGNYSQKKHQCIHCLNLVFVFLSLEDHLRKTVPFSLLTARQIISHRFTTTPWTWFGQDTLLMLAQTYPTSPTLSFSTGFRVLATLRLTKRPRYTRKVVTSMPLLNV